MKPIDFRDATFEKVRSEMSGDLARVYEAWIVHGPATTREISTRAGIDILNVRPRTTDLHRSGMVTLADQQPSGTEGVYRARRPEEWEAWRAAQAEQQTSGQMLLI